MAELPVPAKTFFDDFSFSLLPYKIKRSNSVIATLQGLSNEDEYGTHIAFLHGADIQIGDILLGDGEEYLVKKVKEDTYHGTPELTKAYY